MRRRRIEGLEGELKINSRKLAEMTQSHQSAIESLQKQREEKAYSAHIACHDGRLLCSSFLEENIGVALLDSTLV